MISVDSRGNTQNHWAVSTSRPSVLLNRSISLTRPTALTLDPSAIFIVGSACWLDALAIAAASKPSFPTTKSIPETLSEAPVSTRASASHTPCTLTRRFGTLTRPAISIAAAVHRSSSDSRSSCRPHAACFPWVLPPLRGSCCPS